MSSPATVPARPWIAAAKLGSWPKLLVPFALGQAIGASSAGRFSLVGGALGLAFTLCDVAYIVFLNDWSDQKVDGIKRRMFPNSSGKTLVDGWLSPRQLLVAGIGAGVCALLVAFAAALLLGRPSVFVWGALGLAVFQLYSLPPARLNYRGGGEAMEMLGVGLVLPLFSVCTQAEFVLTKPALGLLFGFTLLSLSSAGASGLSDERSDRQGGKRTLASVLGNRLTRRVVESAYFGGVLVWLWTGLASGGAWSWSLLTAAFVGLWYGARLRVLSPAAITDAFDAHRAYKQALHHGVWRGGMSASMLLMLWMLL